MIVLFSRIDFYYDYYCFILDYIHVREDVLHYHLVMICMLIGCQKQGLFSMYPLELVLKRFHGCHNFLSYLNAGAPPSKAVILLIIIIIIKKIFFFFSEYNCPPDLDHDHTGPNVDSGNAEPVKFTETWEINWSFGILRDSQQQT